jgi:antirestriction protein
MNTIDTRDLIDERNETKETILIAYNEEFETGFTDYEEINVALTGDDLGEVDYTEEGIEKLNNFTDVWSDELNSIREIDELENDVDNGEFEFGTTLIEEDSFEDYCEEFVEDSGYINRDIPSLIRNNIDWKGIAEDMKQDYSEVEFRGDTYLYR